MEGLTAQSGFVAVFYYPKSGLWHFAVVEAAFEGGFIISECNYNEGECGARIIMDDYYALKGFFVQPTLI